MRERQSFNNENIRKCFLASFRKVNMFTKSPFTLLLAFVRIEFYVGRKGKLWHEPALDLHLKTSQNPQKRGNDAPHD